MKNLWIRLLITFIDVPSGKADNDVVEKWLAEQWTHPGFQAYCKMRIDKIIRSLSGGEGLTEIPRDDYVRHFGQRFEILRMAQKAKGAYLRAQKKLENKK